MGFLFVGPFVEQVNIGGIEPVLRPDAPLLINNVAFIGPHNIPQLPGFFSGIGKFVRKFFCLGVLVFQGFLIFPGSAGYICSLLVGGFKVHAGLAE